MMDVIIQKIHLSWSVTWVSNIPVDNHKFEIKEMDRSIKFSNEISDAEKKEPK